MQRHTFTYSHSRDGFDYYTILGEKEGRFGKEVARLALPRADANHDDALRMVCFLLDALTVRDAEGLAPADWVEIGSDAEEDEEALRLTEAYDEGFRDGSAAAFDVVGDEVDEDEDEDELYSAKSYEAAFKDGYKAAVRQLEVSREDEDLSFWATHY